ncbi:YciI family protein [Pontitalea aquivivens]|uniref:YciI family protein n=1 Tax=Pontitalea aquivivens TaxID=3388663 RepID=UPI003970EF5D
MIYTEDCEHGPAIREQNRDAHLAYLDSKMEILIASGGLQDETGKSIGACILVDLDTLAEAQEFAAQDPFAIAGLFRTITIQRWNQFYLHGRKDRQPFHALPPLD